MTIDEMIEILKPYKDWVFGDHKYGEVGVKDIIEALKGQVDRPTGKWVKIFPARIYECSLCGQIVMTDDIDCYSYCHNCGARMKGADDE